MHRPQRKYVLFYNLLPVSCLARGIVVRSIIVKQPLINVEERIDRFVGRRVRTPNALSLNGSRKSDAIAWRKAFGGVRVPRGVFRFDSHEEADQWWWRMISRPRL